MMKVLVAENRGFCFGVQDAVELALRTASERTRGTVYALGPIIHNPQEVGRLEDAGVNQSTQLDQVPPGSTLLIRSHGVRPEVIEEARRRGLQVVDATCKLVKRAQQIVQELHDDGYQVVMIGDANHPEVMGVVGYADEVIVINSPDEAAQRVPDRARLGVVAQTTHAPEYVAKVVAAIVARPFREVKIVSTLCNEVSRRQSAAVDLCGRVDVMFIIGGLHSANTRQLARLCEEQGVTTWHLETWDQFRPEMVVGKTTAGVAAGTSTPERIVQDFVKRLEQINPASA
ncbi:MAG: 4-hydroxy-3-methylbut-2-enyl diphosphate reductase [Phycisphaerae bacterium]|nr:4-hydroxy-3-methylbut-2-enyl diphosphate reductase [Phycisphaerae bacterium]